MKKIGFIPARYASKRLPGKALKKIGLNIYNNEKIIHCPVLGNNFTVSTFIESLSTPETFMKSNIVLVWYVCYAEMERA